MRIRWTALAMACALALPLAPLRAAAQDHSAAAWPRKPVTLVAPFPPGGTSTIIGRQLALQLGEVLGATVVVDYKAGAATATGASHVARAPKDGYTLLLSSGSTFTTTPQLLDKLPYKLEDFAPVALVASVPFALVVKKDFPAKTLQEFTVYAKANPGKVNNATNGKGSMVHLLGELVATGLDIKLTPVHYKGAAPAAMDMIGGIVDANVEALTSALPNVQAGKYRALAVLSTARQPLMPDVPTFSELGYPAVVGETWFAVFAPAGTPQPIVDKLNAALRQVTSSARFGEAMRQFGNEARSGTPADLLAITEQEHRKWGALIQRLGLKAE